MEDRFRTVAIGHTGAGKTRQGRAIMDAWLMRYPGKEALIIDPKTGKSERRYFVPNRQIGEGKDGR